MKKTKVKKNIAGFIQEEYSDYADKILLADGFDEAFLGIVTNSNGNPVATYSITKCLDVLEKQFKDEENPEEDALEYFNYNVIGSYVGEFTPLFLNNYK